MARDSNRSNMGFSAWLQAIGDEAAATLLGFSERTVRSWRLKERYPLDRSKARIVAAARGAVTWDMLQVDVMTREGGKP